MMFNNSSPRTGIRSTFKVALVLSSFFVLFSLFMIPDFSELLSPSNFMRGNASRTIQLSVPEDREPTTLPDFSNGGIIVFYHIYKTGGSTVGKLLHELAREDQAKHLSRSTRIAVTYDDWMESEARLFFTMIRKRIDWEKDCLKILDLAETKKVILLELHVEYPSSFPSLVEFAPILDRWRTEAHRRGVDFFAFSLLREPVSHALSFFNFFHVGKNRPASHPPTAYDHDAWNPFRPLQSTEKNFLHSYFANNRQCRMLSSDPQSTRGAPLDLVWSRESPSQEDIDALNTPCRVEEVYESYFTSLDWVGTTENLQNETLPLLTKLVANDPSIGRNNAPFKVYDNNEFGIVGLKEHNLSKASMTTILKETELDRALYDGVTRNFKLSNLGWDYHSPMNNGS